MSQQVAADLVSWEAWQPWLPDLSEKDEQEVPHIEALTSAIKPKAAQLMGNQGRNKKKKALTSILSP